MEDHERGYVEGYEQALKAIQSMIIDGASLSMIKAVLKEELEAAASDEAQS